MCMPPCAYWDPVFVRGTKHRCRYGAFGWPIALGLPALDHCRDHDRERDRDSGREGLDDDFAVDGGIDGGFDGGADRVGGWEERWVYG